MKRSRTLKQVLQPGSKALMMRVSGFPVLYALNKAFVGVKASFASVKAVKRSFINR